MLGYWEPNLFEHWVSIPWRRAENRRQASSPASLDLVLTQKSVLNNPIANWFFWETLRGGDGCLGHLFHLFHFQNPKLKTSLEDEDGKLVPLSYLDWYFLGIGWWVKHLRSLFSCVTHYNTLSNCPGRAPKFHRGISTKAIFHRGRAVFQKYGLVWVKPHWGFWMIGK